MRPQGDEEGSAVAAQEAALDLQAHVVQGEAGGVGDEFMAPPVGAALVGACVERGEEDHGEEGRQGAGRGRHGGGFGWRSWCCLFRLGVFLSGSGGAGARRVFTGAGGGVRWDSGVGFLGEPAIPHVPPPPCPIATTPHLHTHTARVRSPGSGSDKGGGAWECLTPDKVKMALIPGSGAGTHAWRWVGRVESEAWPELTSGWRASSLTGSAHCLGPSAWMRPVADDACCTRSQTV